MTYADRIDEAYSSASSLTMAYGAGWYPRHHAIAQSIGRAYGFATDQVAAVMSVLSAGTRWNKTIESTIGLCHAIRWGRSFPTIPSYGKQVQKAIFILNSPRRGDALLDMIGTDRALKTRNFYLNLLSPDDAHPVTLDRWMWRIVGEEKAGIVAYREYAEAIRDVAAGYGLLPNQVQATAWLAVRGEDNVNGI